MEKPTHKALTAKLRLAREAFENNRVLFADKSDAELQMARLGFYDLNEYLDCIYACIQLALYDPLVCFRQPRPPKSTKHKLTKNLLMWAFVVDMAELGHNIKIYFKFCVKEQQDGTYYCHISGHEDEQ